MGKESESKKIIVDDPIQREMDKRYGFNKPLPPVSLPIGLIRALAEEGKKREKDTFSKPLC